MGVTMRGNLLPFTIVVSSAIAFSTPLAAQNVTADITQIAEIMRAEGLQAKIGTEDSGRPYILSGLSGYNFYVYPYGCNDDWGECKFVQFRAIFSPTVKPTLAEVNKHAADNFFARFYIDEENDPVIEKDIDLEAGGMSRALFVDNLAYWDTALVTFADAMFAKDE